MALTKIGSIGINTGIQFAGVTTIATLNASDNVLSVGGTVNFTSDVSIGGSVSIGGTLTYEDVTNIDSVGLITARNGIEVGASPGVAASISVDGNAIFSGITTIGGNVKVGTGVTLSPDGDVFTTGVSTFIGDVHIDTNLGGENNRLYVGSKSVRQIGGSSNSGFFQIEGTSTNSSSISLVNNQNSTQAPVIRFGKTRGTAFGAATVVSSGDLLGSIAFAGADGTDLENTTVRIKAIVNGTVAENQIPTDLVFETSATTGSAKAERLRITNDGYFLVGATASRNVGGRTAALQLQGITGTGSALSITRNSANSSGPHVDFAKSRVGNLTDNTVPQDGDSLGEITFSGADGTDTVSMGVRIRATLDEGNGAVGVNSMPGKLSFQTSSAGNQNPTERLAINSAGISTFFNDVTIDARAASPVSADLFLRAGEGGSAQVYLIADDGDDNSDFWRISSMAGFSNRLIFFNYASGSYTDVVSFQTNGSIRPGTTNQANLGSSDYRWANVYTNDLNLSNKGSTNNVDGTWGDYTIQEGETDLYLINNRSGKKYKFNLTEVS